ncbi:MAG: hypothetical protein OEZ51_02945 [Nitrospinota bacterium]|nr:hypothetical protein [Nitrospinota bacterium]
MAHKKYNLILLIPLGILLAVFISLGLWVQPINGDLTRLGGFTENDFGWNKPQQQFPSVLFTFDEGKEYKNYHDVVVLGDSFSHTFPLSQWQNYFVRETGYSLITYKVDDIDIESFVNSPAFKDRPPRIVIYQTVERSFVGRGNSWNKGDCQPEPTPALRESPLKIRPGIQTLSDYTRSTENGPLHPNLSSGAHYLKRLIKKTFNKKSNRAIKIALSRNDLFSNRQSSHLLVYRNDFERYGVLEEDLKRAICGLTYIQNTFQKNGKTYFVGMVAPDKLTAYMDVYKDFDRKKIHWMDEITKHPELHVPRLDVALKKEIERGTQDVYLPNDTHWGSSGHQAVASHLLKYLIDRNILAPFPGNSGSEPTNTLPG